MKVDLLGPNDHRLCNMEEETEIMPNEIRECKFEFYDAPGVKNNLEGKQVLVQKNDDYPDLEIELDQISTVEKLGRVPVRIVNKGSTPLLLPEKTEIATATVIEPMKNEELLTRIPKEEDESCDTQKLNGCLCDIDLCILLADYQGLTQMGSRFEYRNLENMQLSDKICPGIHILDENKIIIVPDKDRNYDKIDARIVDELGLRMSCNGKRKVAKLIFENVSFFNDSTLQLTARLRKHFKILMRSLEGIDNNCEICQKDKLSLAINEEFSKTVPDVRIFISHTNEYPDAWCKRIKGSKVSELTINELKVSYFQSDANTITFVMHFAAKKLVEPRYICTGLLLLLNQIKPLFCKAKIHIGMNKGPDSDFDDQIRQSVNQAIKNSCYLARHADETWKRPVRRIIKNKMIETELAPIRIAGCECAICLNPSCNPRKRGK